MNVQKKIFQGPCKHPQAHEIVCNENASRSSIRKWKKGCTRKNVFDGREEFMRPCGKIMSRISTAEHVKQVPASPVVSPVKKGSLNFIEYLRTI